MTVLRNVMLGRSVYTQKKVNSNPGVWVSVQVYWNLIKKRTSCNKPAADL